MLSFRKTGAAIFEGPRGSGINRPFRRWGRNSQLFSRTPTSPSPRGQCPHSPSTSPSDARITELPVRHFLSECNSCPPCMTRHRLPPTGVPSSCSSPGFATEFPALALEDSLILSSLKRRFMATLLAKLRVQDRSTVERASPGKVARGPKTVETPAQIARGKKKYSCYRERGLGSVSLCSLTLYKLFPVPNAADDRVWDAKSSSVNSGQLLSIHWNAWLGERLGCARWGHGRLCQQGL